VKSPVSNAANLVRGQLIANARRKIREIDAVTLKARLDAGEPLTVIDVREHDEWAQGHIPGARFIPRGLLEFEVERQVPDADTPLVITCAVGNRSALAALTLNEMGYRNVVSLGGGFDARQRAGYPVAVPAVLSEQQRIRYARHMILDQVGEAGQIKLLQSRVLVVGAGGLGSPAALYLAAAGVGTLGIVDGDAVDLSNLQRQILYRTADIGRPKANQAAAALREVNPDVTVIGYQTLLTSDNAQEIISGYDLIVNGSDNFPTRYLVNDAGVLARVPVVDGSILQFEGRVTVYDTTRGGPCYRCLFPEPPPPGAVPSCSEAGVLGILPGIVGTLQAVETIKLILGIGRPLIGRLLLVDALEPAFDEVEIRRNPDCPVCGDHPTVTRLIDYQQFCGLANVAGRS
jgi:adenylyltransferase/sulfurtransferase